MKKIFILISLLLPIITFSSPEQTPKDTKSKPTFRFSGFISLLGRFSLDKEEVGKSYLSLGVLGFRLDGSSGHYGFHVDYRFTGTDGFYYVPKTLGSISGTYSGRRRFNGYSYPHWLEEGYVYTKLPFGKTKIKVGSIYTPFGLYKESNIIIKSLLYYSGFSKDADYGIVYEGAYLLSKTFLLSVEGGYFLHDDRQNGTRNSGSILGVGIESESTLEERDTGVGRLRGTFLLDDMSLALGASILAGRIRNTSGAGDSRQLLWEVDLSYKLNVGELKNFLWVIGEMVRADRNRDNIADIEASSLSQPTRIKQFDTWMVGLTIKPFQNIDSDWINWIDFRANYSWTDRAKGGVTSDLLVAGIGIGFAQNFILSVEYIKAMYDTSKGDPENVVAHSLYSSIAYLFW